jgi:uncharacterized protein
MASDTEAIQAPPAAEPIVTLAQPSRKPEPVAVSERLTAVDVLRGVAVLGILAMNIVFFAWPGPCYSNPLRGGGFTGLDRLLWICNHLFIDGKMVTLFTMLFGAGLVLMGERADAQGRSLAWLYYRRVFWLLLIGAAHGYLLWSGDVLFFYAECGLLLYPFRRRSARTLLILGILVLLVIVPIGLALGAGLDFLQTTAAQAEAARAAGGRPTKFAAWIHEVWTRDVRPFLEPSPEKQVETFTRDTEVHRGSYAGLVRHNVRELLGGQTIGFLLFLVWFFGGRMLLGMGLMKLGVFSAARSWRFYGWLVALGYGVGLPLVAYDTFALIRHDFHYPEALRSMALYNYLGSVIVALGHVGVVMLVCKSGALSWLTRRLAAVGRMALSNYLAQSVICTVLFDGFGFGLFATIHRTGLAGIVLAIWIAQLIVSPIWLARFNFGPAEWLWRSLTYWRLQPLRRAPEVAAAAVS